MGQAEGELVGRGYARVLVPQHHAPEVGDRLPCRALSIDPPRLMGAGLLHWRKINRVVGKRATAVRFRVDPNWQYVQTGQRIERVAIDFVVGFQLHGSLSEGDAEQHPDAGGQVAGRAGATHGDGV